MQLSSNEGSLQDPLEALKQLEGGSHSRAVIAALKPCSTFQWLLCVSYKPCASKVIGAWGCQDHSITSSQSTEKR